LIAIIDYGMGNLRSVEKAFAFMGAAVEVTDEPARIAGASGVVLPGVGAFGDAMQELQVRGLVPVIEGILQEEKPFLGICLGYQLLFESSEESPGIEGLCALPGRVVRFPDTVKVPHMGWNDARWERDHPVLGGVDAGSFFYFVHSYYVLPDNNEDTLTITDYGLDFASGSARGNLVAFQFHPEKSSAAGLHILGNFADMCGSCKG
jgi:imidazole glycerol-phosphate synthase subunit HisH